MLTGGPGWWRWLLPRPGQVSFFRERWLRGTTGIIGGSQWEGGRGRALGWLWAGHKPRHLGRHRSKGGAIGAVWGAPPGGMAESGQGGWHRPSRAGTVGVTPRAPFLRPAVG